MSTLHFHRFPLDDYERLVAVFGEMDNSDTAGEGAVTRWVQFGAGATTLFFFPAHPEPVVRDPESWQAVAREGRRRA